VKILIHKSGTASIIRFKNFIINSYSKVYTGSSIFVLAIKTALIGENIFPIIKDQSESARLAGFGSLFPFSQDVFVHNNEKTKAIEIIKKYFDHMFN